MEGTGGAGVYVRSPCPGVLGLCAAALALALEVRVGEVIPADVLGLAGELAEEDMDADVEGRVGVDGIEVDADDRDVEEKDVETDGVCDREADIEGAAGV